MVISFKHLVDLSCELLTLCSFLVQRLGPGNPKLCWDLSPVEIVFQISRWRSTTNHTWWSWRLWWIYSYPTNWMVNPDWLIKNRLDLKEWDSVACIMKSQLFSVNHLLCSVSSYSLQSNCMLLRVVLSMKYIWVGDIVWALID